MIVKNDLFDYKNRYIFQDSDFFKFSLDSILLSEYVNSINLKNKEILDLCTGDLACPLILSEYTKSNITGFEIQKEIYDLAVKSLEINDVKNVKVINDDFKNIDKYYDVNYFDIIMCNPPYFKGSLTNNNSVKSIARHEIKMQMEDIFKVCKKYLKDNGCLFLVHTPSRLDEIIVYANKYNMNVKNVTFVTTKENCKPEMVLVKCVKNSKMGVIISANLCTENLKTYQNIFRKE